MTETTNQPDSQTVAKKPQSTKRASATELLTTLLNHGRWEIRSEIEAVMRAAGYARHEISTAARELRIEHAQCPRPGTPPPAPIHPTMPGPDAVRRLAWRRGKALWRMRVPAIVQPYPVVQSHGDDPAPGRNHLLNHGSSWRAGE